MGYQFAEQLIRDVSKYKATDVATLLSFMREFQLMFADPGDSPEAVGLYGKLYALLLRQKTVLGIRDAKPQNQGPFVVSTLRKINRVPGVKPPPTHTIRFFSNGHIGKPDGPGTWNRNGNDITLRWPDRAAPGGAWIESLKIAGDGRSARGKNQLGHVISIEVSDGALLTQ